MEHRIVVFSDSHNHIHTLNGIVRRHQKADLFLHLGDGFRDAAELQESFPEQRILSVKGNCDLGCEQKYDDIVTVAGVRIFFTHGHRYGVKSGWETLLANARAQGAGIALFGHTHEALSVYQDGIYLLNPGSTDQPRGGPPSYGIIDITDAGIIPQIVTLSQCRRNFF